jgi:gliding motility-associated protein GldM
MAGGKQTARQKMINLMYLVFIAMLALNMSKEVLRAFGVMEERLTEANAASTQRNEAFLQNLATKASEQPEQYAAVKQKADQVNSLGNDLTTYLEGLKGQMMKQLYDPAKNDPTDTTALKVLKDYEVQDQSDFLDGLLFKGDNLSDEGQVFIAKMDAYREGVVSLIGGDYPEIGAEINKKFSTSDVKNKDNKTQGWLQFNYELSPFIASKTKMSQIQSDVKTTETEILSKMLGSQQEAAMSFTQYNTLLEQSKSAFYANEAFDGGIVLGRKDPNTKPNRVELTLDGRPLTASQYTIENGKVKLNISAGAAGDHKIEGNLIFLQDGTQVEIPVDVTFATIAKPNAAVIAADKMNVVYRGVENPMTVSIPGIADNKVSASASNGTWTKVTGSKYNFTPSKGATVIFTANGILPDGQKISTPAEFRIKDIPRPVGSIRGETGEGACVRMQREGLKIASVGAALEDFDFDLGLKVTGFSFKVSGQPTVIVSGNKLSEQAKSVLNRARRGETVQIFDINASLIGNSTYKLKKISPVCIELTN